MTDEETRMIKVDIHAQPQHTLFKFRWCWASAFSKCMSLMKEWDFHYYIQNLSKGAEAWLHCCTVITHESMYIGQYWVIYCKDSYN